MAVVLLNYNAVIQRFFGGGSHAQPCLGAFDGMQELARGGAVGGRAGILRDSRRRASFFAVCSGYAYV